MRLPMIFAGLLFFPNFGVADEYFIDLKHFEEKTFEQFEGWDVLCRENNLSGMGNTFACGARYQAAITLFHGGWCLGEKGQSALAWRWHKCNKDSNLPADLAARIH